MRARTTENLIQDVRTQVGAPRDEAADGMLSNSELLSLCDQELEGEIGPLLISTRSEYWLRTEDQPISVGKASYSIPYRSLAMGLRDVTIVDSAGEEWNAIQVPASERQYSRQAPRGRAPFDFTLEDGKVVLLPTPTQAGYTLRLRYYATPPKLVQTTDAARITGLAYEQVPGSWSSLLLAANANAGDTQVRLVDISALPPASEFYIRLTEGATTEAVLASGTTDTPNDAALLTEMLANTYQVGVASVEWAPVVDGSAIVGVTLAASASSRVTSINSLVDVVRGGGMFDPIVADVPVTSWDVGDSVLGIDLSSESAEVSTSPTAISEGGRQDYVCVAGETVYPSIPAQLWPTFVSACARAYCGAVGDMRGFETATAILERRKRDALGVMIPRVDGERKRPIPRHTPLRRGARGWR
ncbi:hypothetical protein [Sandaracinus amylolyticus]|uniref:phage adaptor protein n=1 Tax=Sandaracinus amylolyticus TaxID=927083 RepID=UPI001F176DFA|nr:hypothetical protein [Sandaracinus amylolyticus]UJR78928.1 Hypothetical protein I5071_9610 [Sandaracinus amylolyticus]